jgi:hypothetical protein
MLNATIAESLAPFALSYTPEQQAALDKIDVNIKMFRGYKPTQHVVDTLTGLVNQRAELCQYFSGFISRSQLSYPSAQWLFKMPEWGYARS